MTRRARRTLYPTTHTVGPYRIATMRHRSGYAIVDDRSGYAIVDDRTGRPAYTEAHPITGRPRAVLVARLRDALATAATL